MVSERIATKCPACHNSTLVIGGGNWLVCSLIGCPDPTRINSVGDRADSHFDDLQAIRDERDRLREALRIMKEATYQGHSAHWDPTGGSGSGCPACQRASELRDQAQAALTPAGQRLTPNEATE